MSSSRLQLSHCRHKFLRQHPPPRTRKRARATFLSVLEMSPSRQDRATHFLVLVSDEAPLRALEETRIESAPRGYHAAQQSYRTSSLKISGFHPKFNTLLRTLPRSFRDFPAPRRAVVAEATCPIWVLVRSDATRPSEPDGGCLGHIHEWKRTNTPPKAPLF